MGVGSGFYMYDVVVKRSLSYLLMTALVLLLLLAYLCVPGIRDKNGSVGWGMNY